MPLALFDEIDFLLNKNAPKKTVFLARECAYRRLLKEVPRQLPDQLPRNKNCNCRGGSINCPMDGARCLDNLVKYQATVVEGKTDQFYVCDRTPVEEMLRPQVQYEAE